ncbi:MAG: hypothetical protein N3H31_04590 [Candidatus Nezhaarchaeota archaeon]|nr:hypothetical protein [Candidatus Nezhaarchaeota archaeon]
MEFRAIPIWHLIILGISAFILVIGSYGAIRGIADLRSLLYFYAIFGFIFGILLYSVLSSKVRVCEGAFYFRMLCIDSSRVKVRWGGRFLVLGRLNWFLVLNRKEFIKVMGAREGEAQLKTAMPIKTFKKTHAIMPLLPLFALLLLSFILKHAGIAVNPIFWRALWLVVTFASFSIWAYWLQHNLRRAIAIGLAASLPIILVILISAWAI